ncbi:MAG: SagB family peptide dehydrogenase [Terriglobia bacterium]
MPISKGALFRRSPHLVCYWTGGELIFENYATGVRTATDPIACQILNIFDRWRPLEELADHLNFFPPSSLRKAVTVLARHSLLERSDRPPTPTERAMESWRRVHWNPAAGFLHFSTKDIPYATDLQATERLLRRQAKTWPMPAGAKRYPKARKVPLPKPHTDGQFAEVLLARRTWRRFSRRPIGLSALGTLLGLTWGVQHWLPLPGQGRVALKTSPSGGARHAIEVYVLPLHVRGLPRGLYHYAADTHRLELVKRPASSRQVARYLPGQGWYGSAAALLLMTAVFPRAQWRYQSARAYRAVLIEAGHLCQTFCLVATWLGLAPFCSMALADSHIEKDLGVDGVTESVLYAAGVGTKPRGVDWAPWPPRRRFLLP